MLHSEVFFKFFFFNISFDSINLVILSWVLWQGDPDPSGHNIG